MPATLKKSNPVVFIWDASTEQKSSTVPRVDLGQFSNPGWFNSTQPVNSPIEKYTNKIQSFLKYEEDWDTYNSPEISEIAVITSNNIIKYLHASVNLIPFFVAPTRDGGVVIEYVKENVKTKYKVSTTGNGIRMLIHGSNVLSSDPFSNVDFPSF